MSTPNQNNHTYGSAEYIEAELLQPTTNANVAQKIRLIKALVAQIESDFPESLKKVVDDTPGVKSEDNQDLQNCIEDAKEMAREFERKCIDFYVNDLRSQDHLAEVETVNGQHASPVLGLYALATVGTGMLDIRFDVSNAELTNPKSWATTFTDTMGRDLNDSSARKTALLEIIQDLNRDAHHTGFDSTAKI